MNQYPDFSYEKSLIPRNTRFLLGIDEVGRGPWAGPVAVGAFLIDLDNFDINFFNHQQVRDSKKLSASQRETIFNSFTANKYSYSVVFGQVAEIDELGIQNSIIKSIKTILEIYQGKFDFALIDGNINLDINCNYKSVVKADNDCFSVASASICAKVIRDQKMVEYDTVHPGYNFAQHKGYGTKNHLQSLLKLGPCPIHRRSYKPIQKILNL